MPDPMAHIVVAPDSFKGSLDAGQAADAMALGVASVLPGAKAICLPLADGGEGTLAAVFSAVGGERRRTVVARPDGRPTQASWIVLEDGSALIEVAEVVGLVRSVGVVPVAERSSAGVGDLIKAAVAVGCRRLLVALGGSGSNDGGSGLLAALGVGLYDTDGRPLPGNLAAMARLARVDTTGLLPELAGVAITALADVDNPLCGPRGASCVFGPQKGVADPGAADALLSRFADLAEEAFGRSVRDLPGSGAAGGLGFALALLGAERRSGAEMVADLAGLDAALAGALCVITGEGRSDGQTFGGKLPWVVAGRAATARVPALLVSGRIAADSVSGLKKRFAGLTALQADGGGAVDAASAAADLARGTAAALRSFLNSI